MWKRWQVAAHRLAHRGLEQKNVLKLALPDLRERALRPVADVVVGITSYPARIEFAWRTIETLLRQDVRPAAVVLVLAEADFPSRRVPHRIASQQRRGLEVLWVESNGHSFDKLLPVRAAFPDSTIVTVDDDLYFPHYLISELVDATALFPGHIIGARGWRVHPSKRDGKVHFGTDWERAVKGDSGSGLHLPGGNGCLYPAGSLDPAVDDLALALSLVPTNDDIWFWIHGVRAGTKFACLGMAPHSRVTPQTKTEALSRRNQHGQEEQFQNILNYFAIPADSLRWMD